MGSGEFPLGIAWEKPGNRVALLNVPNNPTGYSPTVAEAKQIADVLIAEAQRGSFITVILDDAYFGFGHEADVYPESLIALLGDAHESILVAKVDGPTKKIAPGGIASVVSRLRGRG